MTKLARQFVGQAPARLRLACGHRLKSAVRDMGPCFSQNGCSYQPMVATGPECEIPTSGAFVTKCPNPALVLCAAVSAEPGPSGTVNGWGNACRARASPLSPGHRHAQSRDSDPPVSGKTGRSAETGREESRQRTGPVSRQRGRSLETPTVQSREGRVGVSGKIAISLETGHEESRD